MNDSIEYARIHNHTEGTVFVSMMISINNKSIFHNRLDSNILLIIRKKNVDLYVCVWCNIYLFVGVPRKIITNPKKYVAVGSITKVIYLFSF